MEQLIIDLVAGAIGGNGVGKASPKLDLGTIGNTLVGLVGGGLLGQLIPLILPAVQQSMESGNLSVGGVLGNLVSGGAGGAILTAIVAAIKNRSA